LIWMPVSTKHVLSADNLYFYERSRRSWRFYTISKSTSTFPRVLGVNDGIEHGNMQCVSMSRATIWSRFLPHRLRNSNISALFPHFIHTPSPFHPKIGGKTVEFSNVFFLPDVRMNRASFWMFTRRLKWFQVTLRLAGEMNGKRPLWSTCPLWTTLSSANQDSTGSDVNGL
jgi:hypothetical protein